MRTMATVKNNLEQTWQTDINLNDIALRAVSAWLGVNLETMKLLQENSHVKFFVSGTKWVAIRHPDKQPKIILEGNISNPNNVGKTDMEKATIEAIHTLPSYLIKQNHEYLSFADIVNYIVKYCYKSINCN